MLVIGPACRLQGIRPELTCALLVLSGWSDRWQFDLILTHVIDGAHSRASIHYSGGAADLCHWNVIQQRMPTILEIPLEQRREFWNKARVLLGQDFDLVFEDAGGENEHGHIEYQPKRPY